VDNPAILQTVIKRAGRRIKAEADQLAAATPGGEATVIVTVQHHHAI
jgi:hypothetical protein